MAIVLTDPDAPATARQTGLLDALTLVRAGDPVDTVIERLRFAQQFGMTKQQASDFIDGLLNCPKTCKIGYVKKVELGTTDSQVPPKYIALDWDGKPVLAKVPAEVKAATMYVTPLDKDGKASGPCVPIGSGAFTYAYTTSDHDENIDVKSMQPGDVHYGFDGSKMTVVDPLTSMTTAMSVIGKAAQTFTEALGAPLKEAASLLAPVDTEPPLPLFGYYELTNAYNGETELYYWDVTAKDFYPTLRRWTAPWSGKTNYSWRKVSKTNVIVKAAWLPYNGAKGNTELKTSEHLAVPKQLVQHVANGGKPLTLEQLQAKGKQLNFCLKCGRALTDAESVALGIGPICYKSMKKGL